MVTPMERKAAETAFAIAVGRKTCRGRDRDHISNLPDGVLQHMLSFLPARDAVRTCVLAKRWRHTWKSTTSLRFVCGGPDEPESMEEIQDFVDHLLRLRISSGGMPPLDACEFRVGWIDDDEMARLNLWIRIALQCNVRVLRLDAGGIRPLDDHPFFISQHLRELVVDGLDNGMPSRFLDFSYCPVLEDLQIIDCDLGDALLISSQSLKRLLIDSCSFGYHCRMPICAPNLVSLSLNGVDGRIPSLQRMPSLLAARIQINNSTDDCESPHSDDYDSNQSILLQGLSEVRNLALISHDIEMFIFRMDLKFCSAFYKLKTLLLNEYWCEPADFSALACILKLSPVLEKLTLQLYSEGPKHEVDIKLSCKPLEISAAVSQRLNTVEIKCEVYGERVPNVLAFLSKLNIWFQFSG